MGRAARINPQSQTLRANGHAARLLRMRKALGSLKIRTEAELDAVLAVRVAAGPMRQQVRAMLLPLLTHPQQMTDG